MSKNIIETIVGTLVLAVAVSFIIIAYQSGSLHPRKNQYYSVFANFSRIDGINIGSDVKIGGIKVGTVLNQTLDPENYTAVIEMGIDSAIQLPADTSAEITSGGILGDKYISLTPGADTEMLKNKDKIYYTQSSINLESLIGKFIFGSAEKTSQEQKGGATNN